ncbi:hypothetical protein E4U60_007919 [Claviceps pazoutovae]|uniref:Transcription factor tau 55 kDa subunit n=1 Tax=Claviceps pazoutovae TaxID=1649127 RepID=A0A9P7SIG6_9HYPO|nr:hypothetical protein E4U60_007919 [Claviceps pazoutovae]
MVLERIYVVRHGFRSSWSVDPKSGVYSGIPSPTGIQGDPSLTSYGIDQSKELGAHLMTLDPGVDKVYSSPFYRCLQTMSPFMELQHQRAQTGSTHGQSPVPHVQAQATVNSMLPEHGIREWFGSAPFDHPEPAAPTILKSMFPSYDQGYVSVVTPSKRGETLEQLQDRIAKALRGIVEQCDADGSRAVVLCTHAAVIIMIGRILTGQFPVKVDSDDFKAYTCGLSVYARSEPVVASLVRTETEDSFASLNSRRPLSHNEQDTTADMTADTMTDRTADTTAVIGGWQCHLNSDCSFLSGGPERGWAFSGDESFPGTGSLSLEDTGSKL